MLQEWLRWKGELQSDLREGKDLNKICLTCALGQGVSSPWWRWGGAGIGWGGSDILATRTFPELLLCIHGGGGCHLLYLTLSLPLQLLNSQSRELGERGEGRRVSRTMTRTLKSEGCNSETTCPDPPTGLRAEKSHLRSLGPTGDERPRGWDQGLSGVEIHL